MTSSQMVNMGQRDTMMSMGGQAMVSGTVSSVMSHKFCLLSYILADVVALRGFFLFLFQNSWSTSRNNIGHVSGTLFLEQQLFSISKHWPSLLQML